MVEQIYFFYDEDRERGHPMQTIFKRYEIKYLLDRAQQAELMQLMQPYMVPDRYGETVIRNVYFDTDNYRLIRRSMERPVYKEKLRLRSYAQAGPDSTVFAELKKKYQSVVYKRRLALPEHAGMDWLCGRIPLPVDTQIAREIDYFRSYYRTVRPTVFLSYRRSAFYSIRGDDFRMTFDEDIRARCTALSLQAEPGGTLLIPDTHVLLEIKCNGGMPLWLTTFLTRERIWKTSFSKYGRAYEMLIYPHIKGA